MKNMELPFIRDMFEAIAPRYDLLNRLLSLRQDVYWRRAMVSAMEIPDNGVVLDAACGTGDVALEILRRKGPDVAVFGVDFSPGMLVLAKDKMNHTDAGPPNIHLIAGNALQLPFGAETFDAITIAFGIRNISDKPSVLKMFYDSLKPGGMLLVLELGTPAKGSFLSSAYLIYFKKVLPLIGWFFSKNLKAYQYLPVSVVHFPEPKIFAEIMRSAGFSDVRWRKLTMGIATLYKGYKG
ncbi:bifunctional demethylmenaquinone methyltransferase/2-methoxy-6-polyprenyl-1,4-benzoquinol methylase UbiE [Desulfobacterales bacterium HSG2]|nr:bifunctional demethylmenaquinone methyltransferase/2-methoxy-6-polyprenyl-1,4-benzoquinol methylase UbiE [Desulfobacterales bacterium HSG2]